MPRAGAEWAGVSDVVGRSSNVSAMQSSTVQQDEQTGRQTGAVPSLIPAHGNDLTRVVRPPLKCSCMTRRVSTTSILPSRSFERLRGAQRPLRCRCAKTLLPRHKCSSASVVGAERCGSAFHTSHQNGQPAKQAKRHGTAPAAWRTIYCSDKVVGRMRKYFCTPMRQTLASQALPKNAWMRTDTLTHPCW